MSKEEIKFILKAEPDGDTFFVDIHGKGADLIDMVAEAMLNHESVKIILLKAHEKYIGYQVARSLKKSKVKKQPPRPASTPPTEGNAGAKELY